MEAGMKNLAAVVPRRRGGARIMAITRSCLRRMFSRTTLARPGVLMCGSACSCFHSTGEGKLKQK